MLNLILIDLRNNIKKTQAELASLLGIARTTYSGYERGTSEPDNETLKKLANYYGVTVDFLLGRKGRTPVIPSQLEPLLANDMIRLPILGTIRAGEPIMASDSIEGYEMVEQELLRGRKGFVLRVKGDSMTGDRIHEGDKVIVVTDEDVTHTDIAVVAVNGDKATLKRVKCQSGMCVLSSSNPAYSPMIYPAEEIKVIGKVVQVRWDL